MLRRFWEPVRLFIGRHEWLANMVSTVVGMWLICGDWCCGGGAPCVHEAATKDGAVCAGGCVKG